MPDLRAIMVAVSPEGAIGLNGRIPWQYRGDMRRVKRLTLGTTLIMGRLTWESLGGRPLPGRRNLVVTSRPLPFDGAESFSSVEGALAASQGAVWFFGGARIYQEALRFADLIDVVYVPDRVEHPDAVFFPAIDARLWSAGPLLPHEDEPLLTRREYRRREPGT